MLLSPWDQKQVVPSFLFWERTQFGTMWTTALLRRPALLSAVIEADKKVRCAKNECCADAKFSLPIDFSALNISQYECTSYIHAFLTHSMLWCGVERYYSNREQ